MAELSVTHLLYLHGFRSSPQSAKARLMAQRVASAHPKVQWWCPQLPPSPAQAVAMIFDGIAQWTCRSAGDLMRNQMAVVGSSLGGFYASVVAQRTGCKAVLLNPAIYPARDLAKHIGQQTTWQNPSDSFFFAPEFVDQLAALQPGTLAHPERCMAVIAKGDEVLDWREMAAFCHGMQLSLLEGGDHALSDFEAHVDDVLAFLGLLTS
jgi:uncharacterized protein